jgi:hypothetical protein
MISLLADHASLAPYSAVFHFPSHARDSYELTSWFIENLGFPEDSGGNWDAFEDSLRYVLSSNGDKIAILHLDPSSLSKDDLEIYLDVITKNVRDEDAIDFLLGRAYQLE